MNILICSQYGELQVEQVYKHLKNLGANPVIFERYRKDHYISYYYGKNFFAILRIGDQKYPLTSSNFPVVWYRPKPIILSEIPGESAANIEEKFCMQEWKTILQSLNFFLSDSKWINPIASSLRAANKIYQLKLSMDLGLSIPRTIITNDSQEVLSLFNDSQVIYKTLSSFSTAEKTIYTNQIKKENVLNSDQAIAMAPGIFQEYKEKKYELRVTVVGERVFTVKINSQSKKSTLIDWRRDPDKSLFETVELLPATKKKLLLFHKQLELIYGAYDFIVDEDGNEIFLECNPSGQWLWLEEALDIDISLAMAEELLS
jgi:hypothetical protein